MDRAKRTAEPSKRSGCPSRVASYAPRGKQHAPPPAKIVCRCRRPAAWRLGSKGHGLGAQCGRRRRGSIDGRAGGCRKERSKGVSHKPRAKRSSFVEQSGFVWTTRIGVPFRVVRRARNGFVQIRGRSRPMDRPAKVNASLCTRFDEAWADITTQSIESNVFFAVSGVAWVAVEMAAAAAVFEAAHSSTDRRKSKPARRDRSISIDP